MELTLFTIPYVKLKPVNFINCHFFKFSQNFQLCQTFVAEWCGIFRETKHVDDSLSLDWADDVGWWWILDVDHYMEDRTRENK